MESIVQCTGCPALVGHGLTRNPNVPFGGTLELLQFERTEPLIPNPPAVAHKIEEYDNGVIVKSEKEDRVAPIIPPVNTADDVSEHNSPTDGIAIQRQDTSADQPRERSETPYHTLTAAPKFE
ncbi:hypothetical protein MW887_001985 [Aspergillus wentii]|nr:hypothetical protein MW887_001985 [Aspergillus wentii]